MKKPKSVVTDEGDELPELDMKSDLGQLIHLLEYARRRGFKIGPTVQINQIIVQVADLSQQAGDRPPPDVDIWKAHGHEE